MQHLQQMLEDWSQNTSILTETAVFVMDPK